MRRYLLIILFVPNILFGQNNKFTDAILKGKEMLYSADTITDYVATANYFERVKANEKGEWLPAYYQALSLTFSAMRLDVEEMEKSLNRALEIVIEGEKINENSELVALEGFIHMMRLTVDPGTRGQTLSPIIFKLFNKSLAIDSNNPRAMLFLGQMEYGTAQFFGSGTEKACGYIQKAKGLFDEQPKEQTIYPTWGDKSIASYLNKCK